MCRGRSRGSGSRWRPAAATAPGSIAAAGWVPADTAGTVLAGPGALGPDDGVHLLHSMGDTFAVMATLEQAAPASAVIVGAGYIGLEMADALTVRGLQVTQMEQLPEVLPTVDPELGALVNAELAGHGVEVLTGTTVQAISKAPPGGSGRLHVQATAADGSMVTRAADMVLVVVGVRPETALAAGAGAGLGVKGAIAVDPGMRTSLPDVFAAGDCVITRHRLLGVTYLPLGTTAHKQGRVAGENALGDSLAHLVRAVILPAGDAPQRVQNIPAALVAAWSTSCSPLAG